jgi:hypothetical protein
MALYFDPVRETVTAMRHSCPNTVTGTLLVYFMVVTLYGLFSIAFVMTPVIDFITVLFDRQDDQYPPPIGSDLDSDDDDGGGFPPLPPQPKTPRPNGLGVKTY